MYSKIRGRWNYTRSHYSTGSKHNKTNNRNSKFTGGEEERSEDHMEGDVKKC